MFALTTSHTNYETPVFTMKCPKSVLGKKSIKCSLTNRELDSQVWQSLTKALNPRLVATVVDCGIEIKMIAL